MGNGSHSHYTLKHRAISFISRTLCDRLTYTVRNGPLRGMKRMGGLGWLPIEHRATSEQLFLNSLDVAGRVVYDIGAFEGLMAMLFAKRGASQIVCYEPNSRNRERLCQNIKINGLQNVTIRDVGLGEASGTLSMSWSPDTPGGASVDSAISSGILEHQSGRSESISVTTLDEDRVLHNFPAPRVIKIDIEGFELQALRGARGTIRAFHPDIYLEMHGETMPEKQHKVAEIVAFLSAAGYSKILHIESKTCITPTNSSVAAEGHLFAS